MLLNKTPFYLERGHCYGLVGQNGVGKTTLLTRVAAGDINNFPKDVSCYYIQHEILAEAGTSVTTFMLGQVPEGCGEDRINAALDAVGFSAERKQAAVSELSGGWRMKLAIARSMLWDAGASRASVLATVLHAALTRPCRSTCCCAQTCCWCVRALHTLSLTVHSKLTRLLA